LPGGPADRGRRTALYEKLRGSHIHLNPAELTRYARQMSLENWGREAQQRLKCSQVLIAGAGGLATAAAIYLLAGGVGILRLVDGSRVGLSDLNHQILFRERDLGKAKAEIAKQRLREVNSFSLVESHVKVLSEHNYARLTSGCNLLLDASNSSPAGLLLNRAAIKFSVPLIHAWAWGLNGRLATFWPGRGPCLACASFEATSPTRPALLSSLPGVIGTLLSLEGLRILGGLGPALLGEVLTFNGSDFQFTKKNITTNPHCPACRL
jgi:molybdopterin/thiamine biosynthesis adenylyltransferase